MNSPDPTASNFYDRLAVQRSASAEEIKRAYAKAVREYSPERHPDEFQRIREAYETLSDPESRTEYDATSDPAVEEALERGQSALQEGDYETAERAFKRALVVAPEAHFIRNLLGVVYLQNDAYSEALNQFERLTEEWPDNHTYWIHRATAEHRLEELGPAKRHYQRALELESDEVSAYQGLAQLLADREQFDEAEELIERGIHADGVVNFEDITLFFELIRLRLLQRDLEGIEEIAERMESVISEEWQRTRVAYRFATLAHSLVELQAFELALVLAERSQDLAPNDEEIAEFTDSIRQDRAIIEQLNNLAEKEQVRDNLKALFGAAVQDYFDAWESAGARQKTLREIGELLQKEITTVVVERGNRQTLSDELEYVEDHYPELANVLTDEYKANLRAPSQLVTHAWLTCPHCGNQARAQDETAQYQCPDCSNSFYYDQADAQTKKKAKGCVQQLLGWVGYAFLGFLFLSLLQTC